MEAEAIRVLRENVERAAADGTGKGLTPLFNASVESGGILAGLVAQFGALMARVADQERRAQDVRQGVDKARSSGDWEMFHLARHQEELLLMRLSKLSQELSNEIRAWRRESLQFVPVETFRVFMEKVIDILKRELPKDPAIRRKITDEILDTHKDLLPYFTGEKGRETKE